VVADSSKIGKIKASFVGSIEDIGTLVTDSAIDPAALQELRGRGVRVMLAGES
jgi:DeoR/GlpR family transcriptional regulator of sugar metabolism